MTKSKKAKPRKRAPNVFRSPAMPYDTSSEILATVATWFFDPRLTLDQANKLVEKRHVRPKKTKKRKKS